MPAKPTMLTNLSMRMGPGPNEKIGMKKSAVLSAPVEETQFGRLDPKLRFLGKRLSSTLANSYGVGERIRHAVPDMAWNFDSVSVRP